MTNGEVIEQLENTIGLIKQDGKDWLDDRDIPILEVCIKSLTALDKIKAEITEIAVKEIRTEEQWARGLHYAIKIIDKYINQTGSESKG